MLSLALTSGWYYICTSYYTLDNYKVTQSECMVQWYSTIAQYMLIFSYTSVICDYVTMNCDRCVIVTCSIILTPNSKSKNKKFK